MTTRTPLMAITAVQALCSRIKKKLVKPTIQDWRCGERSGVEVCVSGVESFSWENISHSRYTPKVPIHKLSERAGSAVKMLALDQLEPHLIR